ncbi:MAG: PKHD-type hydroxylase, partial [Nitratireductor sp.]
VTPVTKGVRLASFFWVQSLVREDSRRALLWELDGAIADVRRDNSESDAAPKLMAVYHNLLREWSNT